MDGAYNVLMIFQKEHSYAPMLGRYLMNKLQIAKVSILTFCLQYTYVNSNTQGTKCFVRNNEKFELSGIRINGCVLYLHNLLVEFNIRLSSFCPKIEIM